jgi:hypothetical protein
VSSYGDDGNNTVIGGEASGADEDISVKFALGRFIAAA